MSILKILIIFAIGISSCTFQSAERKIVEPINNPNNILGITWTSEKLDSTGKYYTYFFDTDGICFFKSFLPQEGIAVAELSYKLNLDTLIIENDTIQIKHFGMDTIQLNYYRQPKSSIKMYKNKEPRL